MKKVKLINYVGLFVCATSICLEAASQSREDPYSTGVPTSVSSNPIVLKNCRIKTDSYQEGKTARYKIGDVILGDVEVTEKSVKKVMSTLATVEVEIDSITINSLKIKNSEEDSTKSKKGKSTAALFLALVGLSPAK